MICKTSSYFFPRGHTPVWSSPVALANDGLAPHKHRHTQTNNLFSLTCSTRRGTEGKEILWRAKRKKKKLPGKRLLPLSFRIMLLREHLVSTCVCVCWCLQSAFFLSFEFIPTLLLVCHKTKDTSEANTWRKIEFRQTFGSYMPCLTVAVAASYQAKQGGYKKCAQSRSFFLFVFFWPNFR